MEAAKGKRRKILRFIAIGLLALIVLVVALPLWLPWVLRPGLTRFGIQYDSYDRQGYSRFAVEGISGQWGGTKLKVERVAGALPFVWWRQGEAARTNETPLLRIVGVELAFGGKTSGSDSNQPGSFHRVMTQVMQTTEMLKRTLPTTELTNARVVLGTNAVEISYAKWRAGRLNAVLDAPKSEGEVQVQWDVSATNVMQLTADWAAFNTSLKAQVVQEQAGWQFSGAAHWRTNEVTFHGQFPTNGWWPTSALLNTTNFCLPAHQLRVRGYDTLMASVEVRVVPHRVQLDARGVADPSDAFALSGFPTAEFELAAMGDTNGVTVETLQVHTPGIHAVLTNSAQISWRGELGTNPALFRIEANLADVPDAGMTGQIRGTARIEAEGSQPSALRFDLSAARINAGKIEAQSIGLVGELSVPELTLDELSARFDDGSTLRANGILNLQTREVKRADWSFEGSYLNRFLRGVSFENLTTSGTLEGPFTNLQHRGELRVAEMAIPRLKPLQVEARWAGRQLNLDSLNAELATDEARLAVGGGVNVIAPQHLAATVTNLSWQRQDQPLLALGHPCEIGFVLTTNTSATNWTVRVSDFALSDTNRSVTFDGIVSWPMEGTLTTTVTNLALRDFSGFVTNEFPAILLEAAALSARWTNGPVHAGLAVAGMLTNSMGKMLGVRTELVTGDAVNVKRLAIETEYASSFVITGSVPVLVEFTRTNGLLTWRDAGPIALTGRFEETQTQAIHVPLGARGEAMVEQSDFAFHIEGTRDAPMAWLEFAADSIAWQRAPTNGPIPTLKDFVLGVQIQPNEIRLEQFSTQFEGQAIQANGTWPLNETAWRELWFEKKIPPWDRAQGNLDVPQARLAALQKYLPDLIAPEGLASARLQLEPGQKVDGIITVTNVSTRPFGRVSPLRDITALIRFDLQHATLEDFHGQIGGQPIAANGFVHFPQGAPLAYELNLVGTNVPLARSPEFLLRGNFDLHLRGQSNAPPTVTGEVTLKDGLLVQHASAALWSGPKRPTIRPPYFSLTNEMIANWAVDLAITGDRFLRVRTPVFSGLLSATLNVRGPLRMPVLTGDVRANSGRVLFPFGALDLNQGFASFTGNDPLGPLLQIAASGRNYRYDVRMDVKGPLATAAVTFSATPPLTSEQILLMLTAGELPQTDYTFSTQARASRLATFLGKDLLSRFLGSGQGEERLIIRSGEDISEEGRLTYEVEYRLTDRWSIIGEYDEYNAFNTDLKWKLFER